jgi:hypothetical protein
MLIANTIYFTEWSVIVNIIGGFFSVLCFLLLVIFLFICRKRRGFKEWQIFFFGAVLMIGAFAIDFLIWFVSSGGGGWVSTFEEPIKAKIITASANFREIANYLGMGLAAFSAMRTGLLR